MYNSAHSKELWSASLDTSEPKNTRVLIRRLRTAADPSSPPLAEYVLDASAGYMVVSAKTFDRSGTIRFEHSTTPAFDEESGCWYPRETSYSDYGSRGEVRTRSIYRIQLRGLNRPIAPEAFSIERLRFRDGDLLVGTSLDGQRTLLRRVAGDFLPEDVAAQIAEEARVAVALSPIDPQHWSEARDQIRNPKSARQLWYWAGITTLGIIVLSLVWFVVRGRHAPKAV
jgi:hypothetical protein